MKNLRTKSCGKKLVHSQRRGEYLLLIEQSEYISFESIGIQQEKNYEYYVVVYSHSLAWNSNQPYLLVQSRDDVYSTYDAVDRLFWEK